MNNVYSKVVMWGDEMSPSVTSVVTRSLVIAEGAELLLPSSISKGNIILIPSGPVKIPCEGKVTIDGHKTCLWNAPLKIGLLDVKFFTIKGNVKEGQGKIWFLPVKPAVAFRVGGEFVVTELAVWNFVMIAMVMPMMPNPAGGNPIPDPQPIIGANGTATLQNNPNKKVRAI